MDVSQVKGSADSSLSWGVTYQDTETEKFAIFLDHQDNEPDTVRESRSREENEPYEKPDYADKDIDERDDRDDLNASDASNDDKRSERGDLLVATIAPLKSTPQDIKSAVSDAIASSPAQTPAVAAPKMETTSKTGTESTSPLTGLLENSEKNSQGIIAANKENGKELPATSQAGQNAALASNIREQGVAKNAPTRETGAKTKTTPAEISSSAAQATEATERQTPKIGGTASKVSEGSQATTSSTQAVAAQENSSGKSLKAGETSFLEKIRADESASLTEKEVLSSKISEMLRSAKGKITSAPSSSLASPGKSPSLISGQNAVTSSVIPGTEPTPTATAIGTVTNATAQAAIPISMQPVANSPAPLIQQAPLDPSIAGNSAPQSAAIPGVDSSSANSVSQSASATRASMQAGSPAEQVSAQITSAVRSGLDQIKIQLNPAELGLVDIKLEIGQDGRVMATISASNQESLDLLQQDSKTLEQALKDAGFETDSDSLNFSLNQHNDQEDAYQTANQGDDQTELEKNEAIIEAQQLQAYRSSSDSNLDIQV